MVSEQRIRMPPLIIGLLNLLSSKGHPQNCTNIDFSIFVQDKYHNFKKNPLCFGLLDQSGINCLKRGIFFRQDNIPKVESAGSVSKNIYRIFRRLNISSDAIIFKNNLA